MAAERLKMKDLMKATGLPRSTILHYIAEDLLPEPVRTSRNVARYQPDCVDRVRLIRQLQSRKRWTLAEIRKYMQKTKNTDDVHAMLSLSETVFGPEDQCKKYTKKEMLQASGLSERTLDRLCNASLLVPVNAGSFDEEDVAMARMYVQSMEWGLEVRDFLYYARLARELIDRDMALRTRMLKGVAPKESMALTEEMTQQARAYRSYIFERTFKRRVARMRSIEE
jgi:DNA-binding transcriptional MerR regulator